MAALTPQITSGATLGYSPRIEQFDTQTLLRMGLGSGFEPTDAEKLLGITSDSIRADCLQLALFGYVERKLSATTETNDTVTSYNLTDQGVTFAAGTLRRLDVESYITADADAGLLRLTAVVAGGTTPLVAQTKLKGIEDAATATSEGGIRYSVAAGDFLASGLIVPVVGFEQNTNKVRLTFTGITNIDMFWFHSVRIYPAITQTFPVTD